MKRDTDGPRQAACCEPLTERRAEAVTGIRRFARSFTKSAFRSIRSRTIGSDCVAIVRAISGLGRSLNITTTAEGVETTEQLDWFRAEGCNEVQGVLFSSAKPAAEVEQLLRRFGARASRAA